MVYRVFSRLGMVKTIPSFSVLEFVVSECQGAAFLPDDYGANRAWGHL